MAAQALIFYQGSVFSLQPSCTVFSQLPRLSAMASTSQRPKERDGVLPTLDVLIQALSVVEGACGAIPPAQIAISSASALLTMIRVRSFPSC